MKLTELRPGLLPNNTLGLQKSNSEETWHQILVIEAEVVIWRDISSMLEPKILPIPQPKLCNLPHLGHGVIYEGTLYRVEKIMHAFSEDGHCATICVKQVGLQT